MENFEFTPENVKGKLLQYIKNLDHFLFNEKDLQVYLSLKIMNDPDFKSKVKLYTEYHIPHNLNIDFDNDYAIWGEVPSIDIVLEHKSEENLKKFILIELKYKHTAVGSTNFERFGKTLNNKVNLVTNQGAQNEGRYDFWKDVKRIELTTSHFENVIGGVAFFLTNDDRYSKNVDNGNDDSAFDMNVDKKEGGLCWKWEKNQIEPRLGQRLKKNNKSDKIYKKQYSRNEGNDIMTIYTTEPLWVRPNFNLMNIYSPNWSNVFDEQTKDTRDITIRDYQVCSVIVNKPNE